MRVGRAGGGREKARVARVVLVYSRAASFDIHKQDAGPNSIPTQSWPLHTNRQQTKLQRQPPLFLALLRCPISLRLCITITPSWFTFADAVLDLETYKMRPFSYAGLAALIIRCG